ncbi:MAG: di-trans,poly-cis-decaprenylcistransferase [Armatimonadetes bacterium]|nr:di-trans,poly-cis-decaprenylcistransferase [Armatimonadota bacterium]
MATSSGSKILREATSRGIDLSHLPAHIAVIMDGNGRWANKKGLGRLLGHREGYNTLKGVVRDCGDLGVRYLTVYAFSAENWRRPEEEVSGLMKLIEGAMIEQISQLAASNVRVQIAGRMNELPPSLRDALNKGIQDTSGCTGLTFTLAINYGGRAEIVDAVKAIIESGIPAHDIIEELISKHLYHPQTPEPDLMIRTAGEMRWSNFLIWQAAYAELVVTDVSWPDFDTSQLLNAVAEYQRRTRKFGALAPS